MFVSKDFTNKSSVGIYFGINCKPEIGVSWHEERMLGLKQKTYILF